HVLDGEALGRRIEQPRTREHACWISQPRRVPEGPDLALRLVARTGSSVEVVVGRRIQQQRAHPRFPLRTDPRPSTRCGTTGRVARLISWTDRAVSDLIIESVIGVQGGSHADVVSLTQTLACNGSRAGYNRSVACDGVCWSFSGGRGSCSRRAPMTRCPPSSPRKPVSTPSGRAGSASPRCRPFPTPTS